jgi:hypothetical protein
LEKFNGLFMNYLHYFDEKYGNVLYQSYSSLCNEKYNHDMALEHIFRLRTHIKDHKLLNNYNKLVGYVESQLNCYEELAGKNQELRAKFDEICSKGEIAKMMDSKIRVGLEIEHYYISDSYDTLRFGDKIKKTCRKRSIPIWNAYDDETGPTEYSTKPYSNISELYEVTKNIQDVADEISGSYNHFALGAGQLCGKGVAGLHVHVSVPNCKEFYNGITYYLPELVALTANSPFPYRGELGVFWIRDSRLVNRPYGNRIVKFTPGKRIWQSHCYRPNFKTVEIRALDAQPTVDDAVAIAGLISALAHKIMDKCVNSYDIVDVKRNFLCAQYLGFDAIFIKDGREIPAYESIEKMFMDAKEYFKELDFPPELELLLQERIEARKSPADRIIDLYREKSEGIPKNKNDLMQLQDCFLLAAQKNKTAKIEIV